MSEVPDATPVSMPDALPASALAVLPLIHVPPIVVLLRVVLEPSHTTGVPEIAAGIAFTVTAVVAWQPVGST